MTSRSSSRGQLALDYTWELNNEQDHGRNRHTTLPLSRRSASAPETVSRMFTYNSSSLELDLMSSKGNDVTIKKVNYNLNRQKAVIKKLQASNRDCPYTVDACDDKNLLLHFQAGLYEFVRKAAHYFYTNMSSYCYEVEIEAQQERSSGHIVQTLYRIRKKGKGQIAYTLNFYHTKSAILANGKMIATFLDYDWPGIIKIINDFHENNPDVNHVGLNNGIRHNLYRLTEDLRLRRSKPVNEHKRAELDHTHATQPSQMLNYSVEDADRDPPDVPDPTVSDSSIVSVMPVIQQTCVLGATPISTPSGPIGFRSPQQRELVPLHETALPLQNQATPPTPQGRPVSLTNCNNNTAGAEPQTSPPLAAIDEAAQDSGLQCRTPANSLLTNHKGTSPMHNQGHNSKCDDCIQTQSEWREARLELQAREKKLAASERQLKERASDLEKTRHQLQTQKALIAGLENRIRELSGTNALLQQIIDANSSTVNSGHRSNTPPPQTPPEHSHAPSTSNSLSMQEEIRSLRDELRWRDLEGRITQHLLNMEHRITGQLQPPPLAVPNLGMPFMAPQPNHFQHYLPHARWSHQPNNWHVPAGPTRHPTQQDPTPRPESRYTRPPPTHHTTTRYNGEIPSSADPRYASEAVNSLNIPHMAPMPSNRDQCLAGARPKERHKMTETGTSANKAQTPSVASESNGNSEKHLYVMRNLLEKIGPTLPENTNRLRPSSPASGATAPDEPRIE